MLGPVADGGHIVWNSTPGCWGPMITPVDPRRPRGRPSRWRWRAPRSATRSRSASRTSRSPRWRPRRAPISRWRAASTAIRSARRCARVAGPSGPQTRIEGIGPEAIRCANCGADATPFTFANGYTIAFDELRTVGADGAEGGGRGLRPRGAAVRRAARQLGPEPDPHLRPARHRRAGDAAAAVPRPDRHLAVDHDARLAQRGRLRLVPDRRAAPVRADRAGAAGRTRPTGTWTSTRCAPARSSSARSSCPAPALYLGDMHALQGDGEIAGHTCDVSGTVTLQVEVVKGLGDRRSGPVPGRRGPAVPGQAALGRGAHARERARPALRRGARSRSRCRSR